MIKLIAPSAAALALSSPLIAQDVPAETYPSPNEIVAQAPASDWVAIPAEDLLVMTLAPAADGSAREIIIQLMPAPYSQGWVENIRTLARARWYDGISVNRVQDNYVVQWGDANHDNPEATGEAKPLPDGLNVMDESAYEAVWDAAPALAAISDRQVVGDSDAAERERQLLKSFRTDPYSELNLLVRGWPIASSIETNSTWPIHCYGMVGVGRSYSPDTGSGAELYTVIGHAPRHLDRNIALVGRVIEGIEHLSSLPRGKGNLGFYESARERVPIESIRVVSGLPFEVQPSFEYLAAGSEAFADYTDARANRRDPFFIVPAGGADICNIPVPIRRVSEAE